MTFTELVTEVMARTRQTSTEAQTRIGREINDRYRRVTTSIGLATSRRFTVTAATTVGNPTVVLDGEKVLAVFMTTPNKQVLGEITFDQWRNRNAWAPASGIPTSYAVATQSAGAVTINLDPVPDAVYALSADVLREAPLLVAAVQPDFAPSFHDVLMYGALSDEWMQLKQDDLYKRAEQLYEQRLGELRYFIAKSGYLQITQGGTSGLSRGPYWPGYTIPTWWR
jgi:hypothetical protein